MKKHLNERLNTAKKNQKDEFYTLFETIEKELVIKKNLSTRLFIAIVTTLIVIFGTIFTKTLKS